MANTSHDNNEALIQLKDDVAYWQNKVSDLCLDLETVKGEVELDDDAITEDHERLERELASVQASLKRLHYENNHLNQQIHERSQDISRQEVQIRSNADDIDKTKSQLDDLIAEDKRRSEAPDLTVQEYAMQLAERGDSIRLQQLSAATYQKISMLVSQQQIMQMAQMYQQMNPDGTPMAQNPTENGLNPMQQQQQQFQQFNNQQVPNQMPPMGFPMGGGVPNGGQAQGGFPPQMFNPMGGFPGAMMSQGAPQQPMMQQTQSQQPAAMNGGSAYMPKQQSQQQAPGQKSGGNRSRKNKQRGNANNN